ncbi:MAG: hypothetical protein HY913_06940 [Desulfomonile tiedjei]|nr:hypothetical protein [Desulfomonile tiedjei]
MKRYWYQAAVILTCCFMGIALAGAGSVDQYINDLKSDNPEVRAKAAYELGCG